MLICLYCNKEFIYEGKRNKGYVAKTCSKKCLSLLKSERISEGNKKRRVHAFILKECEICGKEMQTTDSKNQRVTCSKKCHSERLSKLYQGRKLDAAWISRQNLSKTKEKIIKTGDFPCQKCLKVFGSNTALRSHKSYCTPGNEGKVICEICGNIFSPRGLKNHIKSHDENWKNNFVEIIKKGVSTRKSCQSTSKLELDFFEKLKSQYGNAIVHKFKIDGISHEYDFCIPEKNIIIEFDGDYWHGNPRLFELSPRMKQQFQIDKVWNEKAEKAGYIVIRVWSSEAKDFCLEKYVKAT
jgi:hypothetical protein